MRSPSPVIRFATLAAAGLLGGCALPLTPPASHGSGTPVALNPMFGDHTVLQAGDDVPVWGQAGAGDTVAVSYGGQTASAVADSEGRWTAHLGRLAPTSQGGDLVVRGGSTVTLHDVVVGEVWLCSGQSNMEFTVDDGGPVYRVLNAKAEVAAATDPLIRQIRVERTVAHAPMSTFKTDGWTPASPETVGRFTAVGYFFARDIRLNLHEPVGIILTCWGGTQVESWLSDSARASTSISAQLDARWKHEMSEWPPERVAAYPAASKAWYEAEDEAHKNHTKNPLPWPQPPATEDSPAAPGGLYNGMIAPLRPYAIRGFLWYQGEANVSRANQYTELLEKLISTWRGDWGGSQRPFYIVQLANWAADGEENNRDWAQLRDAQARVLEVPNTGMAVTIDIGDTHNIHPANKQEVGRRLALIADTEVYHVAPEVSGPAFAGIQREGSALRVHFTHGGAELASRDGPVRSLEIAGPDRVFHPASGTLDVDTLVVSSPDVPDPVAVRYAWTNAPVANLYGDTGLPALPFRSDAW